MSKAEDPELESLPCAPERRPEALTVLFSDLDCVSQRVEFALAESLRGRLDLSGLWITLRKGRIVCAVLTQRLAGDAAALWPPRTVAPRLMRPIVVRHLFATVFEALRGEGVVMIQALPDAGSNRKARGDLEAGGMEYVTRLISMRHHATGFNVGQGHEHGSWRWKAYQAHLHGAFVDALNATMEGSLDLPELRTVQTAERLLQAHGSGWRFDPNLWLLGASPHGATGVLLMAEAAERNVLELRFLGLCAAGRGKGLGRAIVNRALRIAEARHSPIELAVDARNTPALHLYKRTGFQAYETRPLYLKTFESAIG